MVSAAYPLLGGGVSAAVAMGNPLPERTDPAPPTDQQGGFDQDFVKNLHDAVAKSDMEMRTFREQNKRRQELYSGHGYGENEENVDTPLNAYSLALRIYQRRLISGDPKVNIRSRSPKAASEAYELSLACEQLFREIDLKETLKEVVHQGLESVGIVKVGVTLKEMGESLGFLHDAKQPFCDAILLENFVYDTNARRWDQIEFCGDKYRIPVEDLVGNPMWDQDAVAAINKEETRQDEDLRHNSDEESVERMGVGNSVFRDGLRKYVTVWDIWLPREKVIVTIPADGSSTPLRVAKWDGPEGGPYHILNFDRVPGNIMPVSPGGHLESLARLLNRIMRKLGNQVDRQKTNPTITPAAANAGDDRTIQDAIDGEVLQVMDPKNTGEIRSGGADQNTYAVFQGFIQLFSWLGGNLDSLGGLASNADTATQQEIEQSGANSLIQELVDKFTGFLQGVSSDLSWYIYNDPQGTRRLIKRLPGTDWELPIRWDAKRRSRPFFLFEFEVDPYSIRNRTPEQRLQIIMEIIPRMMQVAQAKMAFAQMGDELDTEAMWRLVCRYSGMTELSEIMRSGGVPITGAPKADRMPSANSAGGVPREYIRRNVSSGGGQAGVGPGQQVLQQMLSGNGNGQGEGGSQ